MWIVTSFCGAATDYEIQLQEEYCSFNPSQQSWELINVASHQMKQTVDSQQTYLLSL